MQPSEWLPRFEPGEDALAAARRHAFERYVESREMEMTEEEAIGAAAEQVVAVALSDLWIRLAALDEMGERTDAAMCEAVVSWVNDLSEGLT